MLLITVLPSSERAPSHIIVLLSNGSQPIPFSSKLLSRPRPRTCSCACSMVGWVMWMCSISFEYVTSLIGYALSHSRDPRSRVTLCNTYFIRRAQAEK
jgi:hypothetical protein